MSEAALFRDMLQELEGMEHAVTSIEANFLQSMKEMVDAEVDPKPIHLAKMKQIYQKYIGDERFDPDAQTDF